MKYNSDIHHRRSIRLREYDYSSNGAYFVTVCAQGRECLFGQLNNGEMSLNEAGEIVQAAWCGLPERFTHVVMDEFMVMPNHFHGIIMLNDYSGEPRVRPNDDFVRRGESCIRPPLKSCDCHLTTENFKAQGEKNQGEKNQGEHETQGEHKVRPYGTHADTLGRILQVFKSITTVEYVRGVKQSGWPPFPGRLWQRNYYERVVRDGKELAGIREYILHNPMKWADDENNPDVT